MLSFEAEAVDANGDGKPDEARARLTIETDQAGEIDYRVLLRNPDTSPLSVELQPPGRIPVQKGRQEVLISLPGEALQHGNDGTIVELLLAPAGKSLSPQNPTTATYWSPETSAWAVDRTGFVPLRLPGTP